MRVLYDHQIFEWQGYGGVSRYFARLVQGLLELGEYPMVLAPLHRNQYLNALPTRSVYGVSIKRLPLVAVQFVTALNRALSATCIGRLKPDLVHETYYTTKPVRSDTLLPRVLTVHDMIHEKFPREFRKNDPVSENKRAAVARADHVICVSHSTKRDLCELFDVRPEKVSVVHHGFDAFSGPGDPPPQLQAKKPYLLYVGHRGGYKNFKGMLRALALQESLRETFDVIAFGGDALTAAEITLIGALGFSEGAVRQVRGSDELLGQLYRSAAAFVYPSMYEGFGLPSLEAMAHDCPVVASNVSAMPEVIGDAGEYFDPGDIEAQAEAIRRVVFDPAKRSSLIANGRLRLNEFSWSRCAAETMGVYRELIASGGSDRANRVRPS